jgi:transcriptional regulator with XRE-family HTH domain
VPDPWRTQMEALGAFIRAQRQLARLSLRQLAELTSLSNPYLSQVERGMHQPSVRVLKLIAEALNISAETLLIQAGLLDAADAAAAAPAAEEVTAAIRADQRLTSEQKAALIAVYDSMLGSGRDPDL